MRKNREQYYTRNLKLACAAVVQHIASLFLDEKMGILIIMMITMIIVRTCCGSSNKALHEKYRFTSETIKENRRFQAAERIREARATYLGPL